MAKFIKIPTTVEGAPVILFNVDTISSVSYLSSNTFVIYAQSKSFTFTTSADGAARTVSNVYTAMLSIAGVTSVEVVMPIGVTITSLPVVS